MSRAGQVIVVTGSAGLIGRAVCRRLLRDGIEVVGIDVAEQAGDYYSTGGTYSGWRADVVTPSALTAILRAMLDRGSQIGGLVNLAGIDAKPGVNAGDPWRDWHKMLAVNLTGTANACQVFGQSMAEAGCGSIVNIGSVYGIVGPDQRLYDDGFVKPAGYSASKAGVLGLTRWLAAYWGPSGVRCNAVTFGGVEQPSSLPAFAERYAARVPLGRMATVADCAAAIAWLLSDESSYVNGHNLIVDGGRTAW